MSNRKISFLLLNLYKSFPNLSVLAANFCNIGNISKENFKNLEKLEDLHLHGNRIEIIYQNTFIDLESLRLLDLGEKKTLKL